MIHVPDHLQFEQLVFSGGGTRCFWHGGFAEVVAPAIELKPARVAAVSGGALSAATFLGDVERRLLDVMGEALAQRESNVSLDWDEVQENGLTPHQEMYREIVETVIDASVVEKIREGPSFQVLLAHPPIDTLPELSTVPAMIAYEADLALRSTPHVIGTNALGVNEVMVDAREAARDGRLTDLLCAAAIIPPVFNAQRWNDRPVIDGGMVEKAPMPDPDSGRTLVLLTRRFRNLPNLPDRLYVQPSESVPADKIDFTDRGKIEETWESGGQDGHAFLKTHGLPFDASKAGAAPRADNSERSGDARHGGE